MSGSPTDDSEKKEKDVSGFLVFNKAMVKKLEFKEDSSDKYAAKLEVSMVIDVPYGVNVQRVAEDLSKLIEMLDCEGGIDLENAKDDEGSTSV